MIWFRVGSSPIHDNSSINDEQFFAACEACDHALLSENSTIEGFHSEVTLADLRSLYLGTTCDTPAFAVDSIAK